MDATLTLPAPGSVMLRSLVISALMMITAVAAYLITPQAKPAAESSIQLETMIPQDFGGWHIDRSVVPVPPSPELQAVIQKLYAQTLSRTYINDRGERVMLSIAYGSNYGHNSAMGYHRPEVCYPAQGFEILGGHPDTLSTDFGTIPVKRLVAEKAPYIHEPITYWLVIGNQATSYGLGMRLTQLRLALTGTVPDGMLVRVSTREADDSHAFGVQDEFVHALLKSLGNADALKLIGRRSQGL